jgi:glycine hydroxymethyltransferase
MTDPQRTTEAARELVRAAGRITVLTGGTDVHLVLVDLRESELDGQQAEDRLHAVGITVNRNAVPFDPRPPMVTSGIRIGTPAGTTRGFKEREFEQIADWIADVLDASGNEAGIEKTRAAVSELCRRYPVYGP